MNILEDSQQILFIALIACSIFIILNWWYVRKMSCNENYSPFRDTGGIFSKHTGYNYLDDYEYKQYYGTNPWIYPTPTNYYRQLYKNERENLKYLEEQRMKMLKNLKNVP
jgi:hypothetical protein